MHLLFLDESGQPDEAMFSVGGHVIAAADWQVLRERVENALEAQSWPLDTEFKWHGIRTGEVPPAVADALFAALCDSPMVADLIAASTLGARRSQGDASRWHKQLRPRFATHPDTGAADGVGIVEFPKRPKGEEPPSPNLFSA